MLVMLVGVKMVSDPVHDSSSAFFTSVVMVHDSQDALLQYLQYPSNVYVYRFYVSFS